MSGDTLPARPTDDADRTEWVAYAVALGASLEYIEGLPPFTTPALEAGDVVDLARRLGGEEG